MNVIEQQLRQALQEFMAAGASRDRVKIAAALRRITELHGQLGDDAAPMLRHYLERRSYQKALEFLSIGHPESDKPQCGH